MSVNEGAKLNYGSDVGSITYSSNGKLLAGVVRNSSFGNVIQIWDSRTGKRVASFHLEAADEVAFSPNGQTLAITTNEGYSARCVKMKCDDS
jgi:WD40 repeat protein